ncbi:MAG: ROK family protein [Dehalococcoidales bacterium]|nr:ROK family protein [Dehalococcoidales bacterium]
MAPTKEGIYGAVEAGGTKFLCAVGNGPDDLRGENRISTTTPAETLSKALEFFRQEMRNYFLLAVGIGSFGPLDLDPCSRTWGYITSTPKPGWGHISLAGAVRESLGIPVFLDTDVNAAALGEGNWGAGQGLDDFIYLTVGTGIGGGAIVNGRLLHGLTHPEMGHLRLPHDRVKDPFRGSCPYHGDCLEGLASGTAIKERWGLAPEEIPPDHPAWRMEAEYLADGIAAFILTLSPSRIILGGGIMQKEGLLSLVRKAVLKTLNGYLTAPSITNNIEEFIVPPGLGSRSGLLGALALAQERYRS